jgi:hypothetical protein
MYMPRKYTHCTLSMRSPPPESVHILPYLPHTAASSYFRSCLLNPAFRSFLFPLSAASVFSFPLSAASRTNNIRADHTNTFYFLFPL